MTIIEEAIGSAKLFEGISDPGKHALAATCRIREYRKKAVLFNEGEAGQAMFILLSGAVQLSKLTPDGREVVIKVIKPGEMFAEVVLFESNSYPVTATAAVDSEILIIPKRGILALLEQETFRNDFISALMRKQRYLGERINFLTSYDIEDRLRLFLREHFGETKTIACSLSKKDLAAAIGATPESLSRLLLRLKSAGWLEWSGNTIETTPEFWSKQEAGD